MADDKQILQGSFLGVPISIHSGNLEGGRKHSVKQFPGRDTQAVEDLGLLPRKFTLDIVISDKTEQDYFAYRKRILSAVESGNTGELIHPLYGRVDKIKAVTFSLSENFSDFGDSTLTVNFEVNDSTGIPVSANNAITQTSALNGVVQAAVGKDIAERFSVTSKFFGNFQSAVDKVNGLISQANSATAFIGEAAQDINGFSALIGQMSANVTSLVASPLALAQSVTNLFSSVDGLYASSSATFDTFLGFFGFGDDDTPSRQDTAGRIERQKNNDVINGAVAGASLGYAYLSAVALVTTSTTSTAGTTTTTTRIATTRDIAELADELDEQFSSVQAGGASQEVKDALTDLRVQVLDALDHARITASQILPVHTNPTTARLLAFDYYGDDSQGQDIVDLNQLTDVSFVVGSVEVLTA